MEENLASLTSICLRVLATSKGQVAPAAKLPATNPEAKFDPRTVIALASSPVRVPSFLLICYDKVHISNRIQLN